MGARLLAMSSIYAFSPEFQDDRVIKSGAPGNILAAVSNRVDAALALARLKCPRLNVRGPVVLHGVPRVLLHKDNK